MGVGKVLTSIFMPIGLGGLGVGKSPFERGKESSNSVSQPVAPLPVPKAPETSAISEQAQKNIQRRKVDATQSIYGDPLGLSGQANVVRKTLTGQ